MTEDIDLVLRIHRHAAEIGREYRVQFVAEPIVLTEVPERLGELSRQRRRWYRGLIETAVAHRDMMGRRSYGRAGYVLPVFVVVEVFGPLVEGLGYVVVTVAFGVGALDLEFFVLYFVITTGIGVLLSWFSVLTIVGGFSRYDRVRQIVALLGIGVLENLGFRQWKALVSWHGLLEYLRGEDSWGVMRRSGFRGIEDTES
ncbi:glycosyltransferase [Halalkalicoccus jeotgali]|uniref:glycosyltransferase n=1 Tax=Halalkalicoccus jeotgali TaxID=413810 RepID=UPI000B2D917A|nr:glycosyltransferase family 2 protein [Halalkalicoccus jeotgali]